MKLKLLVLIILSIIFIISCAKHENEIIEVYHFKFVTTINGFGEIKDTLNVTKNLKEFGSRTYEVYSEPEEDRVFRYALSPAMSGKNNFIFFEDTCNLVSTKEFRLSNRSLKIYKNYYDRENSVDEESYVYYNPEVGLIAIYDLSWLGFDFFSYKSTKGLLEKFKSDTTGFIKKSGNS